MASDKDNNGLVMPGEPCEPEEQPQRTGVPIGEVLAAVDAWKALNPEERAHFLRSSHVPLVGVNPLDTWNTLEPLPNEYLASLKMNVLHALAEHPPLGTPASVELGVLAGLLKEVEAYRQNAPLPVLSLPQSVGAADAE